MDNYLFKIYIEIPPGGGGKNSKLAPCPLPHRQLTPPLWA